MTDHTQEKNEAWKVQTVRIFGENQRAIGYSYRDTAPTTADEYEFRAGALLEAADALENNSDLAGRLAAAEEEREKFRAQLVEAALRINCAGPVAHRIDVLRQQLTEDAQRVEAERDALAGRLAAAESGFKAIEEEVQAWISDLIAEGGARKVAPLQRILALVREKQAVVLAPPIKER